MKTINKVMTHDEIYRIAINLHNNFNQEANEVYLPAAIAFSLQKNKSSLLAITGEIEASRLSILHHYGKILEDGSIQVDPENIDIVNKELKALLDIEQEVKIYTFKIDEILDAKFTAAQMESIMFMIDEE